MSKEVKAVEGVGVVMAPMAPGSDDSVRGVVVQLDFPRRDGERETLLFTDPIEVIMAREVAEVRGALRAAEQAAEQGSYVVGYVSYEAAPAFGEDYVVRSGARLPLVWFGVFRGNTESGNGDEVRKTTSSTEGSEWTPDTPRADYDAAISALHESFARGELEQVNYTLRLRSRFGGDPRGFYRDLLAAQGSAYGAYLDLGFAQIVSVSPELFFSREGDRIELRPMKGTARRGRWREEDEAIAARLAESVKDRGENVMTAEWMRREVEALARSGTVELSRICEVERYPTVFQLTSTLAGKLPSGTTLEGIFSGLFPSVSVTGVPRGESLRRIAELEVATREVYCGAIGLIRPGGDCVFNVAIRTVWIDTATGVAEYGVGGGITASSTAAGEYDEALAKAAVLTRRVPEFGLLETLRLEDGVYVRLDRHLARLGASAAYFGWPDPVDAARTALLAHARECPRGVRRVRVLADGQGGVWVESMEFDDSVLAGGSADLAAIRPVSLARRPVSRDDIYLYHKTTHRAVHEAHAAEFPDCFDVLLWNEAGELTEFTRGNLVLEVDGVRWTPPRESGLLAGVFRGELLESGAIRERVLREDDLSRATGIWLINSLREWVPVRLVE